MTAISHVMAPHTSRNNKGNTAHEHAQVEMSKMQRRLVMVVPRTKLCRYCHCCGGQVGVHAAHSCGNCWMQNVIYGIHRVRLIAKRTKRREARTKRKSCICKWPPFSLYNTYCVPGRSVLAEWFCITVRSARG